MALIAENLLPPSPHHSPKRDSVPPSFRKAAPPAPEEKRPPLLALVPFSKERSRKKEKASPVAWLMNRLNPANSFSSPIDPSCPEISPSSQSENKKEKRTDPPPCLVLPPFNYFRAEKGIDKRQKEQNASSARFVSVHNLASIGNFLIFPPDPPHAAPTSPPHPPHTAPTPREPLLPRMQSHPPQLRLHESARRLAIGPSDSPPFWTEAYYSELLEQKILVAHTNLWSPTFRSALPPLFTFFTFSHPPSYIPKKRSLFRR